MIPLVLALATAAVGLIGWFWWRGDGELRRGSGERIRPHEVALPDDAFGPVATMLLFGSRQDERTDVARIRLEGLVDGHDGRGARGGGPDRARRSGRPLRGHPDAERLRARRRRDGSGPG